MKPSEQLQVNGERLPASWRNVLDNLVVRGLLRPDYENNDADQMLRNAFSGKTCLATPLCADIVGVILTPNVAGTNQYSAIHLRHLDYLRHTVYVCWPNVYYAIIY